jgi:hypothetical protein
MTVQYSDAVANAALDAVEATIGTAPTLTIRTGAPPASANAAATGTVLATIVLPSDWMAAAASRSKAIAAGPWLDSAADATGTAGHYRITGSGGVLQGTVSQRAADGGTGDMQLDQATAGMVAGQQFSVTAFTLSMAV